MPATVLGSSCTKNRTLLAYETGPCKLSVNAADRGDPFVRCRRGLAAMQEDVFRWYTARAMMSHSRILQSSEPRNGRWESCAQLPSSCPRYSC